jgi:hypothetical protein
MKIPKFMYAFCGEDYRNCEKPFAKHGYTWATNGYLLVRIDGHLCKASDGPDLSKIPIHKLDGLPSGGVKITLSML